MSLYNTKGNQRNEWKIAVHYAAVKENEQIATIARLIRKKKGSAGWDGIAYTDKEFKAIRKKVMEATRKIGKNAIDIDALEKLLSHKKEVILKRKYSAMTTIKKHNVGSKQSEMKSDLLTYIKYLRKRNVRVTRLIIFKKVMKLCPFV